MRIDEAMSLAVELSERVRGTTSPNPPVGAVVLDRDGIVVGTGATRPAGGPHAEVVALAEAGERARGGTLVVTLEPCAHHGRTGPCTTAVVDAGIAAVQYAVSDPNPLAAGGAETLRSAGLAVDGGILEGVVAGGPLRAWLHRTRTGRPHVTWKYAASLDGRSAAADGTSKWITGEQSRALVHRRRAKIDAIIVGTRTVAMDDPALTARRPDGGLAEHQPIRVVVGRSAVPGGARVDDATAPTRHIRTHDPREVLRQLADDCCDVQVEGGPTLAGAFLRAGLVDRIEAYIAPIVLGSGRAAAEDAGVRTIAAALQFVPESVEQLGADVLITLVPVDSEQTGTAPAGARQTDTAPAAARQTDTAPAGARQSDEE